jgi:hypothetical protein
LDESGLALELGERVRGGLGDPLTLTRGVGDAAALALPESLVRGDDEVLRLPPPPPPALAEGTLEALGRPVGLGDVLPLGETLGEGVERLLCEAVGETLGDEDIDVAAVAAPETLACELMDRDASIECEGEGERDAEGEPLAEGVARSDGELLGDWEPLTLALGDGVSETERRAERESDEVYVSALLADVLGV